MRYVIISASTGRFYQPMRPPFHQWVVFEDIDPRDTFPTETDAVRRIDGLIPRGSFFVVGYDPVQP